MPCTPDDVRALDISNTDFPDPPYTDEVLQMYIDSAATQVDEDCCTTPPGAAEKAICALAAHLAVKFANGGGAGAAVGNVTSQSAGGLSISFGAMAGNPDDSFYMTTGYGQLYLMYRDSLSCGVVPLVLC